MKIIERFFIFFNFNNNTTEYNQVRRVLLSVQLARSCLFVFLFCGSLLLLSKNTILCDSVPFTVPFTEYSQNVHPIKCYTQAEYENAIAELKALLLAKEQYFAQAENVWVKELLSGEKYAAVSDAAAAVPDAAAAASGPAPTVFHKGSVASYDSLRFLSLTEEHARYWILRRLDAAIKQGIQVEFCTNFKNFILNHNPPISFFLIEEYFYKHLNQPNLPPAEAAFNKQLHNMYLHDLHRSFEKFEYVYSVHPTKFSEAINRIYVASWKLQGIYNIPWDLAFSMACRLYYAKSIMFNLFGTIGPDEIFSATSQEDYERKMFALAKVYFPVYSYVMDYTNIQNLIVVLQYHQKSCASLGTPVDITN